MTDFRFISDDQNIEIQFSYEEGNHKRKRLQNISVSMIGIASKECHWSVDAPVQLNQEYTVLELDPCESVLKCSRITWYKSRHPQCPDYMEIHFYDKPTQTVWLDSNSVRETPEKLEARRYEYGKYVAEKTNRERNGIFYERLKAIKTKLKFTRKAKAISSALESLNIQDSSENPQTLLTQSFDVSGESTSLLKILGHHRRKFWRGPSILTHELKEFVNKNHGFESIGLLKIFVENYCESLRLGFKKGGSQKAEQIEHHFDEVMRIVKQCNFKDSDSSTHQLHSILMYRGQDKTKPCLAELISEKRFGGFGRSHGGEELKSVFALALKIPRNEVTLEMLTKFIEKYCAYLRHGFKIRGSAKAKRIADCFAQALNDVPRNPNEDEAAYVHDLLRFSGDEAGGYSLANLIESKRIFTRKTTKGSKALEESFSEVMKFPFTR